MNAPPFPLNPTTGERHGNWVWNGATWVCAPTTGIQVLVQVFGASGPYMPSPGLVSLTVEAWGGGGGGGGAIANPTFTAMGGGGGASGSYSRKTLPAALVMGGVQITIGEGGAGATAAGTYGQTGGTTTFGALCTAPGGGGGATADSTSSGYGGAPGPAGVGDIASIGNGGQTGGYALPGEEVEVTAGMGGAAPAMGGAMNVAATLNGTSVVTIGPNGGDPGAGGGGASSANSAASPAGGTGGSGAVVVTEFCWASASGGDDCWNPPVNVNARVAVTHVPWPGPGPCPPGWGGQIGYDGDD